MGQDGHDRGYQVVASALEDLGFEVTMTPLFQLPNQLAKKAVELGVDVLSISSLTAGHGSLIPKLKAELINHNFKGKLLLGGIIPKSEFQPLKENGVDLIFGSGTNILKAAVELLTEINR